MDQSASWPFLKHWGKLECTLLQCGCPCPLVFCLSSEVWRQNTLIARLSYYRQPVAMPCHKVPQVCPMYITAPFHSSNRRHSITALLVG